MLVGCIERLLRYGNMRGANTVHKPEQRALPRVGYDEHIAAAVQPRHDACGIGDRLHGRLQDRRVGHTGDVDVEQCGKGPAGVVVGVFLRVVWRPVLLVQQGIRNGRIGLVHAHDKTARGKGRLRGDFTRLAAGNRHRCRRRELLQLHMLALEYGQQLHLPVGFGFAGRQNIRGGAGKSWPLDGTLALGVVVLEEVVTMR